MMIPADARFLVIRRDNIGDLVCTTPLLAGMRQRYPHAFIAVLVNSYNRAVLEGNPDVDEVHAYTKAKHREPGAGLLGVYARRLKLFGKMRRMGFDFAVLAGPGFQKHSSHFARMAGAKTIIGFTERAGQGGIDVAVPYGDPHGLHEVEDVWRLAAAMDIPGGPPDMKIVPDARRITRLRGALPERAGDGPLVALHISARKPSQRWPQESFVELARLLHARHGASFLLLWSPGSAGNATHPGDDEKAATLMREAGNLPIAAVPTVELSELVAALALSDFVVCADGGAMHVAAALRKRIVCFFGDSQPSRWRPWRAAHELLQPASRDVADVSVAAAAAAFGRLLGD